MELIDWSEKYPNETPLQIAIRQSTYCPCGKPKDIGKPTCGHDSITSIEFISTALGL